jgi:very-short-patch-repair endonuclease
MARDWQERQRSAASSAKREVDAAIARRAARQQQLIRLDQLTECGLGPKGAQARAARGTLHRLHPSVYALHPPPYSRRQIWLAAVYAGGPGSLLSDLCAASHLAIWEEPPPLTVHITNESGRGRSLKGITVHRRPIDRRDSLIVRGIPCTSPTRTVVDCAAALGEDPLEDLLLAADASRSLNRVRLEELLKDRAGQPGIGRLRRLITDDPVETRSRNERRMAKICRLHGIPLPIANHRIDLGDRTFVADFCWPELRLIVEADSWRWHGGRGATERDKDRDQLLSIAGWQVVHFTRDQIKHHPDEVGRRLWALVRRATAASAASAGSSSGRARPRRRSG